MIAAECIGDGYWFTDTVTKYVSEREVFGRPIGQNRGAVPDCEAYIEIEAANLMRYKACDLFDAGAPCGAEANMAKYLAAKASWEAANACIQFTAGLDLPPNMMWNVNSVKRACIRLRPFRRT